MLLQDEDKSIKKCFFKILMYLHQNNIFTAKKNALVYQVTIKTARVWGIVPPWNDRVLVDFLVKD